MKTHMRATAHNGADMSGNARSPWVHTASLGRGKAHFDVDVGLSLEAVPFGSGGVWLVTAYGHFDVDEDAIKQCVRQLMLNIAQSGGTMDTGCTGAVEGIADALVALHLVKAARDGQDTSARFWRRRYFNMVAAIHWTVWPGVAISDPHWEAELKAQGRPAAEVITMRSPGECAKIIAILKAAEEARTGKPTRPAPVTPAQPAGAAPTPQRAPATGKRAVR